MFLCVLTKFFKKLLYFFRGWWQGVAKVGRIILLNVVLTHHLHCAVSIFRILLACGYRCCSTWPPLGMLTFHSSLKLTKCTAVYIWKLENSSLISNTVHTDNKESFVQNAGQPHHFRRCEQVGGANMIGAMLMLIALRQAAPVPTS